MCNGKAPEGADGERKTLLLLSQAYFDSLEIPGIVKIIVKMNHEKSLLTIYLATDRCGISEEVIMQFIDKTGYNDIIAVPSLKVIALEPVREHTVVK